MQRSDRVRVARARLGRASPRGRRFRHFLAGLPLDPDRLDVPAPSPGPASFVICGPPRTGTTLLCAALFQPPRVVTVMEPWDGMRLAPANLFASLRSEIETTGRLERGRLDIAALRERGEVRWCAEGTVAKVGSDTDFLLGVKWPGYWRLLEHLPDTKFLVCVRDPYTTVSSFKTAGGRVALGLQRETQFNSIINTELSRRTRDPAVRRALLYEYITSRLVPFVDRPNVLIVHYERWFRDRELLLEEISSFLGADLGHDAATLREPKGSVVSLTEPDISAINSFCTSCAAIGYDLEAPGPVG